MNRKLVVQVGVLFCSAVLGTAIAYVIAHTILLQAGRAELESYAKRLIRVDDQLSRENRQTITDVSHDNLPFCSDQELDFMRNYVFMSLHVKDLGRVKGGKLYCTTGTGRLNPPQKVPAADIDADGVRVYSRVLLAASKHSIGLIIEIDGVSLVLNPESYNYLDEPPRYFGAPLYDHVHRRLVQAFGQPIPLTDAEVIAGKYLERDGVFYQPMCTLPNMTCVIAAESRRDVLNHSPGLVRGFLAGGALLGGALGLILIQFYQSRRSMESQLRRAVRKGMLTLVYQPIVNLRTNAIVGAEALVRWKNEDGEMVRPDIFVALAEERGFIGDITRLVARRVADDLGDLLAAGKLRVTMNIASQDLADPGFAAYLEGCLTAAQVEPSNVGLELTERSTADQEMAVNALSRLKSIGHVLYIDDFGTGYSSLAYLHQLDIDAIKIDRVFTRTVGTEAVTASVVPQILEMAAQLDLLMVVEGIETMEQAEYFRAVGQEILGQGWLFGMPVTAAQFRQMVA